MYTKLANSILTSTVWMESNETRIVWLTLLAMADKNGEVQASIPGLANVARVSVEDTEKAIEVFLQPDHYSRTKTDEGRRVEEIDGGWMLLNHEKYRDLASDSDTKRKASERQRRYRDRQKRNAETVTGDAKTVTRYEKTVTGDAKNVNSRYKSRAISHTDTDTEAKAEAKADTDKNLKNIIPPQVASSRKKSRNIDKPAEVTQQTWDDWIAVRKAKRCGPITETAMKLLEGEASKAGISTEDAIAIAAGSGWISFKAHYIHDGKPSGRMTFAQQRLANTEQAIKDFVNEFNG